ncbi:MAG: PQQ-like beta-propeller repeat protein [Saprospiraceae bacterium]|nr:PQQ-like beta-propeller repeat protein [Saprospiraceae bacterium]
MKMFIHGLMISFGLLLSCNPEPPEPFLPVSKPCVFGCDTSKFEIMWQRPIRPDTVQSASKYPLLVENDKVLFSEFLFREGDDTLKMYNSKTGQKLWEWFDYFDKGGNGLGKTCFYKNGRIYCNSGSRVYCIDANSGKTIWRTKLDFPRITGNPRMTLIGDYLYHFENKPREVWNEYSTLRRKNINSTSEDWEVVFTQNETPDGFTPDLERPIEWIKPNGDTVLLFQCRYIQRLTTQSRVDFIAYNRSKRAIEFRLDNIEGSRGAGSVKPHAILNNKCYFFGIRTLYCIDLENQKLLWFKQFPQIENFIGDFPLVFHEGKVIVKPEDKTLYILDPNTGAELLRNSSHGFNSYSFALYNNLVHYTGFDDTGGKFMPSTLPMVKSYGRKARLINFLINLMVTVGFQVLL